MELKNIWYTKLAQLTSNPKNLKAKRRICFVSFEHNRKQYELHTSDEIENDSLTIEVVRKYFIKSLDIGAFTFEESLARRKSIKWTAWLYEKGTKEKHFFFYKPT